ncbi:MAG: malate synthase G [Pelagibacteraceae bacterium BACL5 MAG-121128-bin54]|jgi:malate synthase|uniref:malate synthase G n=1 Tax=Candidatus Pelagibacter sp. TaxID=2024849 RepID=UPI000713C9BA|nr:MAG: malate synthase G [Pelagibacteraceae bacterium BACL5 MAG-121015-bin10]KRO61396.1 MAG: malate synthase G [Pelagibacteraceae bacterium BACL5 MAG-121128-bin54]KRO75542.1 MAG: malate synthase G [Pelagibacteraceae bacterium BACL5 MAG-120813-bin20]
MKEKYISINNLKVSEILFNFINDDLLKNTKIAKEYFWKGFDKAVHELAPINKDLLKKRDLIQRQIDEWHIKNKGNQINLEEYKNFLHEIGYLKKVGVDFKIETKNVDDEISKIAGPQLVVPIMNARYALNAANARWMSLYDSLYGTDAIEQSEDSVSERYDPLRGEMVIKYGREFLDKFFPLENLSWKEITKFTVNNGLLNIFKNDQKFQLKDNEKFVGHRGDINDPSAIILKNNNLHIEILKDPKAFSAQQDTARISDIIIESAVSTICDNEDSVAAVDAEDKVLCYRNWLGLMRGDLKNEFEKNGKTLERKLNPDRSYISKDGIGLKLHGRSLLLVRNVGHLMTNSAILLNDGSEIPEGIMDAFITTTAGLHDLNHKGNSRTGSIYIVKPKMHGPEETAFTDKIFSEVENLLGLEQYTCKIGIMDEERRTSANLKECIRTLKNRVFFINTGFLDRTGDEMHTSMEAGPMIKKGDMKSSKWISAYENNNVDIGLQCGFSGVAQIGKGMWAMPDKMKDMMDQKIGHLKAGANCAWVPSPTAAALHALHYHEINIFDQQKTILKRTAAKLDDLLTIPVADRPNWSVDEINSEISNSAQTLLGYVVRWIDQGVGCSKVPDINNVGLMEDRATLRISSQHIANWIHHGITTKIQVIGIMKDMAKIVDEQNKDDPKYRRMSDDFDNSLAFKTACDLIFKGKEQPSGYTEPLLHLNRLLQKSNQN